MATVKSLMQKILLQAEERGETITEKEAARRAEELLQRQMGKSDPEVTRAAKRAAEEDPLLNPSGKLSKEDFMSPAEFKAAKKAGSSDIPAVPEEFRKQYVGPDAETGFILEGVPYSSRPTEKNIPALYEEPGKLSRLENLGSKWKEYQKSRIPEQPSGADAAAEVAADAMGIPYKSKFPKKTAIAAGTLAAAGGAGYALSGDKKVPKEESAEMTAPGAPTSEKSTKAQNAPASASATASPSQSRAWKDISKDIGALRAEMPKEQRASFDNEYRDIENMRAQAISQFKEDKKSQDWGKVAEMLGRAALKLAAGYSGLKSGADLSTAVDSGEKWDWKGDYDALKDQVQMKLDSVEARRKDTQRKEDRITRELEATTGAMRKERSALEEDVRRRDITTAQNAKEQAREDRFYASKNIDAVQKELDALDRVKSGITKKGKLSRDALTTDLSALGIDISAVPEAKGMLWGTKGGDSVDAGELGKVLASHGAKLRARRDQLLQGQSPQAAEAAPAPTVPVYKDGDEKTINGVKYRRTGGKWLPQA